MRIADFIALLTAARTRAFVMALLAAIGLLFPGLIPDGAREQIAEHATALIGAVLGLWAIVAGRRHATEKQQEGEP